MIGLLIVILGIILMVGLLLFFYFLFIGIAAALGDGYQRFIQNKEDDNGHNTR